MDIVTRTYLRILERRKIPLDLGAAFGFILLCLQSPWQGYSLRRRFRQR